MQESTCSERLAASSKLPEPASSERSARNVYAASGGSLYGGVDRAGLPVSELPRRISHDRPTAHPERSCVELPSRSIARSTGSNSPPWRWQRKTSMGLARTLKVKLRRSSLCLLRNCKTESDARSAERRTGARTSFSLLTMSSTSSPTCRKEARIRIEIAEYRYRRSRLHRSTRSIRR